MKQPAGYSFKIAIGIPEDADDTMIRELIMSYGPHEFQRGVRSLTDRQSMEEPDWTTVAYQDSNISGFMHGAESRYAVVSIPVWMQ